MDDEKDLSTGVDGLDADDVYRNIPVFNVSKEEFFGNMRKDRNRIRFTSEKPKQYMSSTNYRKTFYISHTDSSGKQYLSKIK